MNGFQIFGIGVAVVFLFLTLRGWRQARLSRAAAVGWILVWAAAAVAIARPGLTGLAAQVLGIDRGADLIFYCAILGMFIGFFSFNSRLRRMERNLTDIVRHIALTEGDTLPNTEGQGHTSDR